MVAEYYGMPLSMERLREVTRTTERGADLLGLEQGAKALGFETLSAELPYDELIKGDLLPVILHWDRDHFVVVTKASFEKIAIHDPAQGKRTMSRDDFEAHRYGPGRSRAGLILRPGAEMSAIEDESTISSSSASIAQTEQSIPWKFIALSFFYAGALSFVFWTFYTVLQQAIDLQFREGVWQHLGALLLAASGLVLSAYLLRKQAIEYASNRGQFEVNRITEHLKRRVADISRPVSGDLYLKHISDIDDLRVWRAYSMANLAIGVITILVAIVFLVATNWRWGGLVFVLYALLAFIGSYVFRSSRASRETAREAQLTQRKSLYEVARVLPETHSMGGGDFLLDRLHESNEKAEEAFRSISAEYSAERQMIRVVMLLFVISLIGFGLYELGFSGLQVGELLFGIVLLLISIIPFFAVGEAFIKWQKLQPARLRVSELSAPALVTVEATSHKPELLTIAWESATGKEQQVSFSSSCRISLTGSDHSTRADVIAGLLGRPNDSNVRLFFDDELEVPRTLADFGRLSVIDAESTVASGSVASNIAMREQLNTAQLEAVSQAAELTGIQIEDGRKDLNALAGFDGEGLSSALASRTLIARAVYANIDALVLDGATDELPAYDEGLLMDNLLQWSEGRLLVVNANRMNAAYGSDLIINIEETEIDSIGSHERLLAEKGNYYYQNIASQSRPS